MECRPRLKLPSVAERVQRHAPMRRHDAHVEHDVDGIRQLHAHLRQRRAGRPHEIRHDEHRPAAHRAVEQAAQLRAHLGGLGPVVGRARRPPLAWGADKGQVLDARHVVAAERA